MLRCWEPTDAELRRSALALSLEHIRTWIPQVADEPSELAGVARRLERFRSEFHSGTGFVYGLFDPNEREVVGGAGLMPRRGPGVLEIGYWIRVDRVGLGLATEAARALTDAGLAVPGVARIEIHCDAAHAASAAVPRKLGYDLRETVPDEAGPRTTLIFERSATAR